MSIREIKYRGKLTCDERRQDNLRTSRGSGHRRGSGEVLVINDAISPAALSDIQPPVCGANQAARFVPIGRRGGNTDGGSDRDVGKVRELGPEAALEVGLKAFRNRDRRIEAAVGKDRYKF